MDRNKIIIIVLLAIIVVLAAGIGYSLLNPTLEYQNVDLSNGTTIDVPKTDDSSFDEDSSGIKTYTCKSKHTTMISLNSQENSNLSEAVAFAGVREALINNAKDVELYKTYQIKENTINDTHYYITYISNNTTHDNIVIASENLDILKHMVNSLILGQPDDEQENTTQTETPTQTSTESGQYGYCAVCGKALTYAEAHSEYTQGKVCHSCANNPYYQTDEGSKYANQKLQEAYPDEYDWMDDEDT